MSTKTCHCFIKHPTTKAERKVASDALAYARKVNDSLGVMLALSQLTTKCPANQEQS